MASPIKGNVTANTKDAEGLLIFVAGLIAFGVIIVVVLNVIVADIGKGIGGAGMGLGQGLGGAVSGTFGGIGTGIRNFFGNLFSGLGGSGSNAPDANGVYPDEPGYEGSASSGASGSW